MLTFLKFFLLSRLKSSFPRRREIYSLLKVDTLPDLDSRLRGNDGKCQHYLVLFPPTTSRIRGVFVETKPVRDEAFRG